MTDPALEQIERWQVAAAAHAAEDGLVEVVPIGPFRALFDPNSASAWHNTAIPVEPLGRPSATLQAIREVCMAFLTRRRRPHFELSDAAWPELAGLLELVGLTMDSKHPQMACAPYEFTPRPAANIQVQILTARDPEVDLAAFDRIRWEGFEGKRPPRDEEIARMRREMKGGARFALGRLDGVAAGTAVITPLDGVGEMVGVSTLPSFRRHGVAATVTGRLLEDFFAEGGTLAWLDAEDAVARSLYSGLGFSVVGTWLSYIQP